MKSGLSPLEEYLDRTSEWLTSQLGPMKICKGQGRSSALQSFQAYPEEIWPMALACPSSNLLISNWGLLRGFVKTRGGLIPSHSSPGHIPKEARWRTGLRCGRLANIHIDFLIETLLSFSHPWLGIVWHFKTNTECFNSTGELLLAELIYTTLTLVAISVTMGQPARCRLEQEKRGNVTAVKIQWKSWLKISC